MRGSKARAERKTETTSVEIAEPRIKAKGVSGSWYYLLRLFAIVAMVADHLGKILFYAGTVGYEVAIACNMVGRFAFPIFAFLLVESYHFTQNRKKHLLTLGLLAIVSEPFFDMAMVNNYPFDFSMHSMTSQNTIFTLFLGYAMLMMIDELWNGDKTLAKYYRRDGMRKFVTRTAAIVVFGSFFIGATLLMTDYNWRGITLIGMLALGREWKHTKLWQTLTIFFFIIGLTGDSFLMYLPVFLLPVILCIAQSETSHLPNWLTKVLTSKLMKQVCRYFYPAHFVILVIVRLILAQGGQ